MTWPEAFVTGVEYICWTFIVWRARCGSVRDDQGVALSYVLWGLFLLSLLALLSMGSGPPMGHE